MKKYNVKTGISYPKIGAMGKTGTWRIFKPILDKNKCIKCLRCWVFCPESAIKRRNDSVEIDYDYCKGCGVCANVCPVKAIVMAKEER
ncbi:ferredoxin [Euryarchaeota archaeon ex4484_162]|nr:MAG: 4Fe-4S dicluster domain-containing protein [Thermoplasmata archaeon]OYT57792.1 MAG: ferredoxin [Euryarchaeota archaeon ex4484_162]HDM25475.1 4Fe-4S dicluster domain-containing protein [Thermoplasmatales archaeon]MCD6108478.1 4Fe-4S binding protein [Thermoplasmata archaeon]RLF30738.1 MAG: ferredoxin [Thermoplasmata archaeon]